MGLMSGPGQTEKWRCVREESVRLRIADIDRPVHLILIKYGSTLCILYVRNGE
jgi:hypothetical protein